MLSLKTSTSGAFNQQLKTPGWDRLGVTVSQTDNYVALDSLRTTLQNLEDRAAVLEALRPGGCNCNCSRAMPMAAEL